MIEQTNCINIKIKTINSEIHQFALDPSTKILDFKKQIQQSLKIPLHRQRLIFKGKLLVDNETLNFYKIEEGHVVQLVANTQAQLQSASNRSSHLNHSESSRVQAFRNRNNMYQRHRYLQRRMNGFKINRPESLEVLEQNQYTINQLLTSLNNVYQSVEPFAFKNRKFDIGVWVDVKDSMGQWYEAQVVDTNNECVLIHYNGWSDRWNQWISASSARIMPFRSNTVQSTHCLYMSPFPQHNRQLSGTNNRNFQSSIADLMKSVSETLEKVNSLVKESQQNHEEEIITIKEEIIAEKSEQSVMRNKMLEIEFQEITLQEHEQEHKQNVQTPVKEIPHDNLSNKCDDNMSNKCENDDMSNKSYKSKRSEGLVDTSSMKSLKIQQKPNVFFDLEAKSVRSMKSEIHKQNTYTYYLNNPTMQENILQEEDSQLQQQDSYEQPKSKLLKRKQQQKQEQQKKQYQKFMKASQLAPLLDRLGRMLIDLAPHVAMLGHTDQLPTNENLSIATNEGSLQSRIMNYLRSNNVNTSEREINQSQVTPPQYCEFQVPIMLTPIEIYALNEIQADHYQH